MNFNPNPYDPFSLLDNEVVHDTSSIKCCKKCGSINIEIDVATNKIKCKNCNETDLAEPDKKSSESLNEIQLENEQKNIIKALKNGTRFGI